MSWFHHVGVHAEAARDLLAGRSVPLSREELELLRKRTKALEEMYGQEAEFYRELIREGNRTFLDIDLTRAQQIAATSVEQLRQLVRRIDETLRHRA